MHIQRHALGPHGHEILSPTSVILCGSPGLYLHPTTSAFTEHTDTVLSDTRAQPLAPFLLAPVPPRWPRPSCSPQRPQHTLGIRAPLRPQPTWFPICIPTARRTPRPRGARRPGDGEFGHPPVAAVAGPAAVVVVAAVGVRCCCAVRMVGVGLVRRLGVWTGSGRPGGGRGGCGGCAAHWFSLSWFGG